MSAPPVTFDVSALIAAQRRNEEAAAAAQATTAMPPPAPRSEAVPTKAPVYIKIRP